MAEIITDIEKLSDRAEEVNIRKEGAENSRIIIEMKTTIRENGLTTLSAPQIGYNKRIVCVSFDKGKDIRTFINPVIVNAKGLQLSRERCSSIPNKEYIRPRNNDITVMYQTPMSKTESRRLVGLAAIVFQHSVDHLDGLLLSDVGIELPEGYDDAPEAEREEFISAYLDSLDIKKKEIETEIEQDETLKKTSDAINFLEKVQKGEVTLKRVSVPVANDNNNQIKETEDQ